MGKALLLTLSLVAANGMPQSSASAQSSDPSPMEAHSDPTEPFRTPEFNASVALEQIGAQHAYARGAAGGGARIAVIDGGIDLQHRELAGQFLGAVDYTTDLPFGAASPRFRLKLEDKVQAQPTAGGKLRHG